MNEGKEIRFIDLYSGIGGIRLGLERASQIWSDSELRPRGEEGKSISRSEGRGVGEGCSSSGFRCVWSCDNNKYANQIYTKQFGEANHHSGDIRGVNPEEIPDFDLLCAGFPCPSFSVAGPRTGFQDPRGTLFFEISRIAEAKRPKMLLLENVRGLLSNDRGQTFQTILQELGRIGYWTEWQILNSKHHGVPQNRERVFIIGHLRNGSPRSIFPIGQTDEMAEEDGRGRPPVQPEVSTAIDGSYYKGVDRHGQRTVVGVTLANTSRYNQGVKRSPLKQDETSFALGSAGDQGVAVSFTNPHNPKEKRKVNLSNLRRAVKPPYGNQQPLVRAHVSKGGEYIPSVVVLADRPRTLAGKGRNLESPKPITNALSGVQKDNLLLENFRIRRLTPVECERLQGFPDGWTAHGICKKGDIVWTGKYKARVEIDEDGLEVTRYRPIMTKAKSDGIYPICDTNRYKCLGNAVTINVIAFLGTKIMN